MPPRSSKSRSSEPLRAFSRSLPMSLLRTREAVMAGFRPMLRKHDVTEQQWRVLRALTAAAAPPRLGEIAAATFLSEPSLSRIVRTLEARGLVERRATASDLRATQLSLTRSGRALFAKIAVQSEAIYRSIAERVGIEELERLYVLLERTRSLLEDDGAGR